MNEEAVKALLGALDRKAIARGVAALTEAERDAWVPVWALLTIGSGGFRYFLDNSQADLADAARRFRHLGLDAAGAACERVASEVFPGGAPADHDERSDLLARVDWSRFGAEEGVLVALTREGLYRAIGDYARRSDGALAWG